MKKIFSRRTVTVDSAHMITLHQEAIEQIELMRTVSEASEHATDTMHDMLANIAVNHWESYLDVIHMICMHDDSFAASMKKHGVPIQDTEANISEQRQYYNNRSLLLSLLSSLMRRHRRFNYFYGLRANPMGEYIKESIAMEREHIAEIIGMVQNMI